MSRVLHCDALARFRKFAIFEIGVGLIRKGKIPPRIASQDQNEAEVFALQQALKQHRPGEELTICSDSRFALIRMASRAPAGVTLRFVRGSQNEADRFTR